MGYNTKQKEKMVSEAAPWRHIIDVGNGVMTPGEHGPGKLNAIDMPQDLAGKSVLDIGAWDGFYSFIAEERGAERVLAIDDPEWTGIYPVHGRKHNPDMYNFLLARELRGSNVEYKMKSVYEVCPEKDGMFDLVLFLGVTYHLLHPALAIERLAKVTKDLLILETGYHPENTGDDVPLCRFHPGAFCGDVSNWTFPNKAWFKEVLKVFGFVRVEFCREWHSRWIFHALKKDGKSLVKRGGV